MGLVLDASVLIGAEREGKPVKEVLRVLKEQHGETEILLSVMTVRWSTVFTAPVPLSAPSAAGTIGTPPLLRFQPNRSRWTWRDLRQKSMPKQRRKGMSSPWFCSRQSGRL